jgi:energy-coupling factor transporter ATP-binding protein EcfA2
MTLNHDPNSDWRNSREYTRYWRLRFGGSIVSVAGLLLTWLGTLIALNDISKGNPADVRASYRSEYLTTAAIVTAIIVAAYIIYMMVVQFVSVDVRRRWTKNQVKIGVAPSTKSAETPDSVGELTDALDDEPQDESYPLPPPPPELLRTAAEGQLAVFVGPGVAVNASYPTGYDLMSDLLDWAVEHDTLDPELARSLRLSLDSGQIASVADAIAAATDREDLARQIGNIYSREPKTSFLYRALGQLPASAVLTTNYDTMLSRVLPDVPQLTWQDGTMVLDNLSHRKKFVLALYGTPNKPDTLLLSPGQFSDTIASHRPLRQALAGLMSTRTMLFVGIDMAEIINFIEPLSMNSLRAPRHFAVVNASSPTWRTEANVLRMRFNIEVLPYSPFDVDDMVGFLSRITDYAKRSSGRVSAPDLAADKVRQVVLENIGPFEDLSVEFDDDFNVLLGDNGVGKSTILKALALVYSGDDGPLFGARMLRSGATRGSVQVETSSGRRFQTELLRSTSETLVRHSPRLELEAERHIVIGIPPLRTLTWQRESGPSGGETSKRPSRSDVVALLVGEPDSRLDSVKQRIINCDYLIKDSVASGVEPSKPRALLDDLVDAINVLTAELDVRFDHVDADSNTVYVRTADGILPVEALSQGANALIGWVGFVIQRLHDTASADEVPLQRSATVLIDEIDAHLHPDWQQQLTARLQQLLPNVQFVATTHSPLMVGGMRQRQVTALTRRDGTICRVPRSGDDDDIIRGRADQLLTSRLFGLTTSVDLETRKHVERYQELLGADRGQEEEAEFRELQDFLEIRVPVGPSTPSEQRAVDFLDLLLKEAVGNSGPDLQARLKERARQLLDEVSQLGSVEG